MIALTIHWMEGKFRAYIVVISGKCLRLPLSFPLLIRFISEKASTQQRLHGSLLTDTLSALQVCYSGLNRRLSDDRQI